MYSSTRFEGGRESAINIALLHIRNDPQAQAFINGKVKPATTLTTDAPTINQTVAKSLATILLGDYPAYLFYIAGALMLLVVIVVYMAWRSRPTKNSPPYS